MNSIIYFYLGCLFAPAVIAEMKKQQPPVITEFRREDHEEGYKFFCNAIGIPTPTYSWFHNERNLKDANGRVFIINTFERLDEGEYRCTVSNFHGTALSDFSVLKYPVLRLTSENLNKNYTREEGTSLVIPIREKVKCEPCPPVRTWKIIQHVEDDNAQLLVLNTSRVIQAKDGSLIYSYLKMSDSQMLKMRYFNSKIDLAIGGSYSTIQVLRNTAANVHPPKLEYIYPESRRLVALEGEAMELQCIFSGKPAVTLEWVAPTSIGVEKHSINATLVVKKVTRAHQGEYKCTGSNTLLDNEEKIDVVVDARPQWAEGGRPAAVNATVGDRVEFLCMTSPNTKPPAEVTWYFNGIEVDKSSPGRLITVDGNKLVFASVSRNDGLRVVQCNASNIHGYVYGNAALNVLARTIIVQGPEKQDLWENTTRVEFPCNVTHDPLTPVIVTWYWKDVLVQDYNDSTMLVVNNNRRLVLDFKDMDISEKMKYGGKYACKATNLKSEDTAEAELFVLKTKVAFPYWIVILLVALLVLLFLLTLFCCWCCRYMEENGSDEYLVGEVEEKEGYDSVKELDNLGFHEYQRPETEPPSKMASRATLDTMTLPRKTSHGSSMDTLTMPRKASLASSLGTLSLSRKPSLAGSLGSLDEDLMGDFTEDGSFRGAYSEDSRKKAMQ